MTIEENIVIKCQICGKEANLALEKNEYKIYRCSACDFMYVNPYPSDNDIIDFYNNNYRGIDVNFYPKARSRQRRAFIKSFRFWKYLFNKQALDIGCGGGFMTNAFRRLGAEAHGVDISEISIAYAKNVFLIVHFIVKVLPLWQRVGLFLILSLRQRYSSTFPGHVSLWI